MQVSTSDVAGTGTKTLHLMRHGQTAMNVYLSYNPYGSQGFEDPLIFDTSLTDVGVEQARKAKGKAKGLRPVPELLVVSPLSRALHTADLAFPPSSVDCPRIMHPLARERLYLSSDVGLPRTELLTAWPHYSTEHVDEEIWWYTVDKQDPQSVTLEPEDVFLERVEELRQFLFHRPEQSIAVVSHSGVLEALTGGYLFGNGEIKTLPDFEVSGPAAL
ncbi:probable phosphatase SPAC5H10.03 [Coccomyxa sp. Obi]|nr:probable phosphatase SPAC5H10.03 [Coccomyxa sp. Obi]